MQFLIALLLWIPSCAAWAQLTLSELAAVHARHLQTHPVLRAQFEQRRQIVGLDKPVLSKGRLVFGRDAGILWIVEQAYSATFAVKANRALEYGLDGRPESFDTHDLNALVHL